MTTIAERVKEATGPQRIQLSRKKGWRMPPNTVKVDRSTKFGNPFTPDAYWDAGYSGSREVAIRHCVDAFRALATGRAHWAHGIPQAPLPDISALRGKNLACWCKPGEPCHADVLLELANPASALSQTVGE